MQKIISLFQRNYETDRLVRNEVVPGAKWVLADEGVPTRKWDGTCALMREGQLFKRYELKKGKVAPEGFEAAQEPDPETGNTPGWLRVGNGPEDKWFREAFTKLLPDGTYELCGPKTGGGGHDGVNPEHLPQHVLIPHGEDIISADFPLTFEGIKAFLEVCDIEGIVWHHPDGRMVKIKKRDFGFKRGAQ